MSSGTARGVAWVLAIAALVSTSIAAYAFSADARPMTTPSGTRSTVDGISVYPAGSTNVAFVLGGQGDRTPLARRLRALSDRRTSARAMPVQAFRDVARDLGRTFDLPDSFVRRGRLLLGNLGQDRLSFYAVLDARGDACYALVPKGEANCVVGLLHGIDPHVDAGSRDERGEVYGLVSNEIVSAKVLVGRRWHRARVAHNAMFYELPSKVRQPRRIVLRERVGATHTFNVVRCHGSNEGRTSAAASGC
jgi:hypothetical protein